MILKLVRTTYTSTTTLGKLYVNDKFNCWTLEDIDRGLLSSTPIKQIQKAKVRSLTAIPKGKYEIIINYSPRFKRQLPLLLNVPGFTGIRIHPGNTAEHTDGCILVGEYLNDNYIKNSTTTFNKLFTLLQNTSKKEKIFIDVT